MKEPLRSTKREALSGKKYADLLTSYCLNVKPGQKVLVKTSTLAEPFVKELYSSLLQRGAFVEFQLSFEDQETIFYAHAKDDQLEHVSDFYSLAAKNYDKLISIQAPYNLKSTSAVPLDVRMKAQKNMAPTKKIIMDRSANKELEWVLCVYPTQSMAQEAGMSLPDYQRFVYNACLLDHTNPAEAWGRVSKFQQRIVDVLNTKSLIRYVTKGTDISFSTKGRTWVNSDGKRNMPSGEVFTSPVEDSVDGVVSFSFPSIHGGREITGVRLVVEKGKVVSWTADSGQDYLDYIFTIPGANVFGEAAIGLNDGIQKMTKNILFDEKMGGSVHMAVGASYPETGGKNTSSVHWDMITDMKESGQIFADGDMIYEKGKFLF